MSVIIDAVKKAEKDLKEAIVANEDPGLLEKNLLKKICRTIDTLISDLAPLMEIEAKKPAWLTCPDRIIDYEVLTVISQELSGVGDKIQIEDSRSLEQLCMDAAELFTKHHFSEDEHYWSERIFLDEVMKLACDISKALAYRPSWINTDYRAMYGSDTLEDLLRSYYEVSFPLTALQTKEARDDKRRLVRMKELASSLKDVNPDISREIYRILDPTE